MRTETITYYYFDELSPEAKEKAIEKMRYKVGGDMVEMTDDDFMECLKKIGETFNITFKHYQVDGEGRYTYRWEFNSHYHWDLGNGEYYEDEPRFFLRWFNNEIWWRVYEGKYFSKTIGTNPYRYIKRHSKVLSGRPTFDCCLTGTYTDYAVDDALNNAWEHARKGGTIEEFIDNMLDQFFAQWGKDRDYCFEDCEIEDYLIGNEYEFLESGQPA